MLVDIGTIIKFLSDGLLALLQVIPLSVLFSMVIGILIGAIGFLEDPGTSSDHFPVYHGHEGASSSDIAPAGLLLSGSFVSPIVTAIVVLSIYHGAYIAEIIRAGIAAIPKGQHEGADSIGLSVVSKMVHVIMPQVWLTIIPSLVGQYVILIKDTTLISAIGVMELLNYARQIMQVVLSTHHCIHHRSSILLRDVLLPGAPFQIPGKENTCENDTVKERI